MNSANATCCLPMVPYTCKAKLLERNALRSPAGAPR